MKTRASKFIPFMIAFLLAIYSCVKVLIENIQESQANTTHQIPESVINGIIALSIVALSILVRRNIWKYLFLIVAVLSFFPFLHFSHTGFAIYIGSLKIDLIAIPLLISHIVLNIETFKALLSDKEPTDQSRVEKVNYFVKKFETKSAEELEKMDEKSLVLEAREARRIVLDRKSL